LSSNGQSDYRHLGAAARELADSTNEERIHFIRTAKWIHYPRVESVLSRLGAMIAHPESTRMPCLLVYGDSGIGKTMLIDKFLRDHPAAFDQGAGVEHRPVLSMEMPSSPDDKRFYMELLRAIESPIASEMGVARLENLALTLIPAVKPRLIIIDEVHNLLAGTPREQRRALNTLKSVTNRLKICIAALGTAESLHAMQSDEQIASRFEPFHLPRWKSGREFISFISTYVKMLPLRKPSDLASDRSLGLLVARSHGITGRIATILQRAAELAIIEAKESIDYASIEKVSQHLCLPDNKS